MPLASYEPSDPAWFFTTGAHATAANFAGRVGAFLAELSFQLFGYASYLIPAAMGIVGWNYFWCRSLDAAGTKAIGAVMLFSCLSAFMGLIFGSVEVSGKSFRAGGYAGEFLAHQMSEYLNRTGAVIVVLTLIVLSTIMSTQFSFGRFFAALLEAIHGAGSRGFAAFSEWREERRREKQRREVIAKHTKKGAPAPAIAGAAAARAGMVSDDTAETRAVKGTRAAKAGRDTGDESQAPASAPLFGGLKS